MFHGFFPGGTDECRDAEGDSREDNSKNFVCNFRFYDVCLLFMLVSRTFFNMKARAFAAKIYCT
jgi:hypothetical protein